MAVLLYRYPVRLAIAQVQLSYVKSFRRKGKPLAQGKAGSVHRRKILRRYRRFLRATRRTDLPSALLLRIMSIVGEVTELADVHDLGSCGATRAGSSPAFPIK
jgi:hypothetical protein